MPNRPQRAWLYVALLAALCCVLAVLQYRWIGEISRAEKERLRDSLHANLRRLSEDFNVDLNLACAALMPRGPQYFGVAPELAYRERFLRWRESPRYRPLFRRIVAAIPDNSGVTLRELNPDTAEFTTIGWPDGWQPLAGWIRARLQGAPMSPREAIEGTNVIDLPRFGPPPMGRAELDWLLLEVDVAYVRDTWLPELVDRHLGSGNNRFAAQVALRHQPSSVIFQSDSARKLTEVDATVTLFDVQFEPLMRGGPGGPPIRRLLQEDSGRGRWILSVQHPSGSLERIVQQARWRNLGVSAAILILMLLTVGALVRYSRQAHRLAELQMNFVAGISHELRTPLTVIRTAGYNLRGKLSENPAQVERYGALIQDESEKLTDMVEQVLRYASASSGQLVRERETVAVGQLIDAALGSLRQQIESAGCTVEKNIAPGLPLISGDSAALRHALQNLMQNAIKYGTEASKWIGVSASPVQEDSNTFVEIRVADRGPGIPREEQPHVFDAFYRGRRALEDQIHGTGLGLNLVKKIVEAHGGAVRVESEALKRTEFIVRIPAAPAEQQDEFAYSLGRG